MAKCNTQANDMAKTTNNWHTPGASNPGRYNKVAEQAMKGLIVRLWPGEAMPGSYFGLVRRLVGACP